MSLSIYLISLLVQFANTVHCQNVSLYYIKPLQEVWCHDDPCFTLSQFAASYNGSGVNVSLIFLPGNHSLERELTLSPADQVSMTRLVQDQEGETVFVVCASQSGRFNIRESTIVLVSGLHFVGCDGNRVSNVELFAVEDTIFQGVKGGSTVLLLNKVAAARLIRTEFLSNGQQHYNISYRKQNEIVNGGALNIISSSNITIVNSNFAYNEAEIAGVMFVHNSSLHITWSNFSHNRANSSGGVIASFNSFIDIDNSDFNINRVSKYGGGILTSINDSYSISDSTFTNNYALLFGGVIFTVGNQSSFIITRSSFSNNSAYGGGVIAAIGSQFSFDITRSSFRNNCVAYRGNFAYQSSFNSTPYGGVIFAFGNQSSFNITRNNFSNNSAPYGGVIFTFGNQSSFNITRNNFSNNAAFYDGGVIAVYGNQFICTFNITRNNFIYNRAYRDGGVILHLKLASNSQFLSSFSIVNNNFVKNSARSGGVVNTLHGEFNITRNTFAKNTGGVLYNYLGSLIVADSNFIHNTGQSYIYHGILFMFECSVVITNCTFDHNFGSLYTFSSNLIIRGHTKFENGAEESSTPTAALFSAEQSEGGAVTSFQSIVTFTGQNSLSNNQARDGGALLATESMIIVYGETTVAYNTATGSSGGGISLRQSDLKIKGTCNISSNYAMRGGGIHATGSSISVHLSGILRFISNSAVNGSGVYLEANSKLYILKERFITTSKVFLLFEGNCADYGGAVYVADDTNSGACSSNFECFVQILALYPVQSLLMKKVSIHFEFSGNTAAGQGSNIFGGLLDRCVQSPFAETYKENLNVSYDMTMIRDQYYSGVTHLQSVSGIESDSISSLPVRVCFCTIEGKPDCSYQPPPIKVKKGEPFTVSLVAVDQVNHSVAANVISSLASSHGGFGEGQLTQAVKENCTNLTYNVFSLQDETLKLYADGPCRTSFRELEVNFIDCSCPIGFMPSNKSPTKCECICHVALSSYVTDCNSTTGSLHKENSNSWITYINYSNQAVDYVTYPNCPFDYCKTNVNFNLNLPTGPDDQCDNNRRGVLCGACQKDYSLSLGSSHCLPCHNLWPLVLVVIILAAIIAGIVLVIALLVLNMTVAVGLINGFIFYANIVSANSAVFFPSSESSFPTVFIAWLNLDIGIDTCFINGLDAYGKTWLQLLFPVYIFSLVFLIIIVCEYSPRFAALIGKRNPIATLATLILLSYARLLSITITGLSFATLDYPDGRRTVWLPDGNVYYFKGKHAVLAIMSLFVVIISVAYALLLFLWQWLVRAPSWKAFKWTRSTKLDEFVSTYHEPYNTKYRFWPGLLLLVRVVLYITTSVTVSTNPQASLLITILLVGSLLLWKAIIGVGVHKKSHVDILETVMLINLLALAAFSLYDFKMDIAKQAAVAHVSTIITLGLLVGVIGYHVVILIKKSKGSTEENEHPLAAVQPQVTHSSIVIPSPPSDSGSDDHKAEEKVEGTVQEREIICAETFS